jgi:hypothetical protein
MLILCQSHHGDWTCTPSIAATSGDDRMDSALECMLLGVRGLLWPHPIVSGA